MEYLAQIRGERDSWGGNLSKLRHEVENRVYQLGRIAFHIEEASSGNKHVSTVSSMTARGTGGGEGNCT